MKTYSNKGFTLVELLLVVTIIAIIGVASISGLSHMTDAQDADTTVRSISNVLDASDREVARHGITSYEAVFESGSLGFATNLDGYKKESPVEYAFDFVTGTGVARSTDTGTGTWEVHLSAYDDPGETYTLSASGWVRTFAFPSSIQKRRYEASSAIGERILNSYAMQYYSLTNVKGIPENEVRLMGIVGGNNTPYTSLTVRNVLGKKVLQGSGASVDTLDRATLRFEKNGKEMEMVISL